VYSQKTHIVQHAAVRGALAPHAIRLAGALLLAALFLILVWQGAHAQSACRLPVAGDLTLTLVADGFNQPLQVTHAGDGSGRLFVVNKAGTVEIIRNGAKLPAPFLDISDRISTCSECGLLSIAFPDDFAESGYFFISYTANTNRAPSPLPGEEDDPTPGNDNVIARYQVDPANPDRALLPTLAQEQVILTVNQPATNHNGGMMAYGADGLLYIAIGDGGPGNDPDNKGQNIESLLGKVLRLEVGPTGAYTIPADNPFVSKPGRDEIWAYGLRNPWRFSFDRKSGDLWIADVGQAAWEEVNFEPAASPGGLNYGWKECEGGYVRGSTTELCTLAGATMPIYDYGRDVGQSVTGGYVYRGSDLPWLRGTYVYGDFRSGAIWGLKKPGATWQNQDLESTDYSISSFGEDEAGELYLTDFSGGVYRFDPVFAPAAFCQYLPAARTAGE
jgi:glucose/arabinose dehydrogenase